MEFDDGDLFAAGAYAGQSVMLDFMLTCLAMALKNERAAGYTADGRQLEPPLAHVVRPALESYLSRLPNPFDEDMGLTAHQRVVAQAAYDEQIQSIQERVLAVTFPHEI